MLINLRNALMAGKRLPYDAEVEFLQSSGTQYINTGIMGASEWHITAQGAATPTTSNCVIATTSSGGSFFGNYGAIDYWAVGNGSSWRCSLPYTSIGSFIVTFSASSVQFTVNGETTTRLSAPNFSKTFYLFSTNGEGFGATVRVYGCKVYQNNVLVRDYIPVRKGTVGYLYDRVSGALFGNDGSGDFALGPDVVPVEYLESVGYQYIDTGVVPSEDLETDITFSYSNITNNVTPFGSRSTTSSNDRYWANYDRHFEIGFGDYYATSVTTTVGAVNTIEFNKLVNGAHTFVLNGTSYTQTGTPNTTTNIILFGRSVGGTPYRCTMKLFSCDMIKGADKIRRFIPVRVGTDATSWEGAMMDVLTRRIYRNAGTGAFGYGNDLKYPIPAS